MEKITGITFCLHSSIRFILQAFEDISILILPKITFDLQLMDFGIIETFLAVPKMLTYSGKGLLQE